MLKLQIGVESFREIRENDYYYVDKTGFIEELFAGSFAKVSLITRPRRFGKTLMMTTLRDFFDISQDSRALFDGLAIANNKDLCDKWMNQYPAVFLTFKEIEGLTFTEALEQVSLRIHELCKAFAFLLDSMSVDKSDKEFLETLKAAKGSKVLIANSLKILCSALHAHYGKPVILLIDEYDVPLAKAQEKGYYPEMVDFIRSLLGTALKTNEFLQFAILTGCLRISKESIFTGLNNFTCFGIADADFDDKFGFTSEEVDALLAAAGCPEKKNDIKEWYDGYLFGNDKEIYCPWDILQYLRTLQTNHTADPKPYWINISGNAIVRRFVRETTSDTKKKIESLIAGGCVQATIIDTLTYDSLYNDESSLLSVLYLTGYLTKASSKQMEKCGLLPDKSHTVLAIPNKEIMEIFNDDIKSWFEEVIKNTKKEFFRLFWDRDAKGLADYITLQLQKVISFKDAHENFYHAFIAGLFADSGYIVKSQRESGTGYPDLLIRDTSNDRAAAIEFKRAASEGELAGALQEALNQGRDKNYTQELEIGDERHYKTISLWGMAFWAKTCVSRVEDITKKFSKRSAKRTTKQTSKRTTTQTSKQTANQGSKRTSKQTARRGSKRASKQTAKQSSTQPDKSSS